MPLYTLLDSPGRERLLKRKITLWRQYNSLPQKRELGKFCHYMKVLRISGLSKVYMYLLHDYR